MRRSIARGGRSMQAAILQPGSPRNRSQPARPRALEAEGKFRAHWQRAIFAPTAAAAASSHRHSSLAELPASDGRSLIAFNHHRASLDLSGDLIGTIGIVVSGIEEPHVVLLATTEPPLATGHNFRPVLQITR